MKCIAVSKCLLGYPCRYDGKSVPCEEVIALKDKYNLIPVCPEIYGGLSTPRIPSERIGGKVMMKDGRDVTENYMRGAETALLLCRIYGIDTAILKAKSPSCGVGKIYDGSFTGTLKDGDGVTAEYLKAHGIRVLTENEVSELG
jgi:uncharacterized protein YbbK (DUF523 family)